MIEVLADVGLTLLILAVYIVGPEIFYFIIERKEEDEL